MSADDYDAIRNSYGCWEIAIAAMRERAVREGIADPINATELRWRDEGPRPVADLDTVKVE